MGQIRGLGVPLKKLRNEGYAVGPLEIHCSLEMFHFWTILRS